MTTSQIKKPTDLSTWSVPISCSYKVWKDSTFKSRLKKAQKQEVKFLKERDMMFKRKPKTKEVKEQDVFTEDMEMALFNYHLFSDENELQLCTLDRLYGNRFYDYEDSLVTGKGIFNTFLV
jgi:hypothetical protein